MTLVLNANAPYGRDDKLSGSVTAGGRPTRTARAHRRGLNRRGGSLRLDLSAPGRNAFATPRAITA